MGKLYLKLFIILAYLLSIIYNLFKLFFSDPSSVHVIFGHVVSGKEVVTQVEMLPVDRNSRPLQDAKVSKCGELVLLSKSKGNF